MRASRAGVPGAVGLGGVPDADGSCTAGPHGRRRPAGWLPTIPAMRRTLAVVLIVGFLAVDFLFFHDVLKQGEVTTLPQYMTGVLSILVFAVCAQSLLSQRR